MPNWSPLSYDILVIRWEVQKAEHHLAPNVEKPSRGLLKYWYYKTDCQSQNG